VDDLKSSHKYSKVNNQFDKWLQENCGEHGEVVIHRGKKHDYLGMEIDFSEKGKAKISMTEYVESMLVVFPEKIKSTDTAVTPASDGLFNEGQGKKLNEERADAYHTMVAKALFLCKRARPDIQPTIAVLCTRVKGPNEANWAKLVRLMKYLNGTRVQTIYTASSGTWTQALLSILITRATQALLCHTEMAMARHNLFQGNIS
jgi:hypothetical protein